MNSKHNNNISRDVIIIKRLYYMSYDDWYDNCKLQEGCHTTQKGGTLWCAVAVCLPNGGPIAI